ncbi:MAG: hypothetical protein BGO67_01890 [Alphaproteobacteria bacterium 41-28]|nr:MAG: hypothetical protein BGO67_01890 [Alphaproteobacteria bacterium 41-28]
MNLKFIVSAIVALPLLSSSLFAKGSTKLFSPDVFHHDGSIDVVKATGAHILHRDGLRGEGRCIAIIDEEFSPDHMDRYIRRGVIHPDAIRDGLFITPREKNFLNYQGIQNKRKRYMDELDRKAAANEPFHGVDVLDIAHSMAPRATILPIDSKLMPGLTFTEQFCNAVRQAMRSNPDVINISLGLNPEPEPIFRVMAEAVRRGIAFTIAAGNESSKDNPVFLDYGYAGVDPMPEVFRRLRGDGMVFAGSLKHKRSGNAVFAKFSQHPLPERGLIYRYNLLPGTRFFSERTSGTSYSSPALAGGMFF